MNATPVSGRGSGTPLVIHRFGARARLLAFAGASAALALFAAGGASAQVNNPPQLPHEVIVFPERDFVSIDGYEPNADLRVQLRRGGTLVSDAIGRTDAQGFLEVNHPGGVCWRDLTPDIVPGDVVRVTYRNTANNANLGPPAPVPGSGDAVVTADVTAEQAVDAGGTVVIRGTAQNRGGGRVPLGRLEVRIINPDFTEPPSRIGRRDIRADSAGGRVGDVATASGTLAYDAPSAACPPGACFTAVFTGLSEYERGLAVDGQTRVLSWQQTDPNGERLGITIYEVGEVGGPGFGGCPPGPGGVVPPAPPAPPVSYNPAQLADAAVPVNQPSLHEVVVFPERDFVSIAGFAQATDLQVVVRRPGVGIIGTARGLADSAGMLEVNHPGGICWSGQTPDIEPGDLVDVFRVVNGSFAGGETQRVIDAVITRAAFVNSAGNLRVRGSARHADGSPFSDAELGMLEQRIINPDFNDTRIGRREIRADIDGGRVGDIPGARGILRRVSASPTDWVATYTGLDSAEQQLAVAGQSRVLAWLSTNAAGDRFGITIYEAGESGGPGFGGCPTSGDFALQ